MKFRRDRQLQQLGITQWALRRPTVLQGIAISIPFHIRLVMVTDEPLTLNETIINDVLLTLKISINQVLQLTSDLVAILPPNSCCNSWRLGSRKAFVLEGGQLVSPSLEELQKNPRARSFLWQQICAHENYFYDV